MARRLKLRRRSDDAPVRVAVVEVVALHDESVTLRLPSGRLVDARPGDRVSLSLRLDEVRANFTVTPS